MSTPLLVQLKERVGQEVHLSDWLTVGQARINAFDAKEAALIEGNRYVQQLEAQIKAYREAQR